MNGIRFTTASLARKVDERIRVAPSQLFRSSNCLWLVLIDGVLLCPELGRELALDLGAPEVGADADIERLVEGARQLCGDADRPVGLMLPLPQFLYSHYAIQLGDAYLGDAEMVRSAILLQKDLLLPAFDQAFELAAATGRAQGVAFWFPAELLGRLEAGFAAAGLELAAVMPRALAIGPREQPAADYVVVDEDRSSCAVVRIEDGVATEVLSAYAEDLGNEDIRQAWTEQTAPLLSGSPATMASAADWLRRRDLGPELADYLFFTGQFLGQVRGKNRQRRITAAAAAAAAAILVLATPFIYQWADALRLERLRDAYRDQARVAAEYQDEMLDLEYEWGAVYEYPEADVPGILISLNSVIDNSLTSFSLNDSTVEIQGFTEDPEQLTRLLVEQPLFETIEQSRSISDSNSGRGDRFGLRMTLVGIDFEEYLRKYDFR